MAEHTVTPADPHVPSDHRHVVALGAPAGEHDLPRLRAQRLGHHVTSIVDPAAGVPGHPVGAGRVGIELPVQRGHGLSRLHAQRGRSGVVEIGNSVCVHGLLLDYSGGNCSRSRLVRLSSANEGHSGQRHHRVPQPDSVFRRRDLADHRPEERRRSPVVVEGDDGRTHIPPGSLQGFLGGRPQGAVQRLVLGSVGVGLRKPGHLQREGQVFDGTPHLHALAYLLILTRVPDG